MLRKTVTAATNGEESRLALIIGDALCKILERVSINQVITYTLDLKNGAKTGALYLRNKPGLRQKLIDQDMQVRHFCMTLKFEHLKVLDFAILANYISA